MIPSLIGRMCIVPAISIVSTISTVPITTPNMRFYGFGPQISFFSNKTDINPQASILDPNNFVTPSTDMSIEKANYPRELQYGETEPLVEPLKDPDSGIFTYAVLSFGILTAFSYFTDQHDSSIPVLSKYEPQHPSTGS